MGHIAVCDGHGGTIEAKGRALRGRRPIRLHGRGSHPASCSPDFSYGTSVPIKVTPPAVVYEVQMRRTWTRPRDADPAGAGCEGF